MKSIKDLLAPAQPSMRDISTNTSTPNTDIDQNAKVINHTFNELMMIKTGWRAMFPSINAKTDGEKLKKAMGKLKQQFMKGFIENDINSIEQIDFGLKRARADDNPFFPSVGEFISWCQPDLADLGLPTAFEAWRIVSNIYSIHDIDWTKVSPAVHEAGKRCNFGDIKRGTISEKQFSTIYKAVCEEVFKGVKFEVPVYVTEMRLGYDAKGSRTTTEQNHSARDLAMAAMKGFKL